MTTIRRALISVSDKRELVPFVQALVARGVEVLSTGGTAKSLREAGIKATDVSAYTGSPEIMDGRVKTLHPKVHAGILMRERPEDRAALAAIGAQPIDLVVVNLYPFQETLAKPGASHDELIEKIDIGGPTMVRAAAKNHARVTVVVDPEDYKLVLAEIERDGRVSHPTRLALAAKAFTHTTRYDGAISGYLSGFDDEGDKVRYPRNLHLDYERAYSLRYGENPHQTAAFYREAYAKEGSLGRAQSIGAGGKELSYNNLVDVDAALEAVRELEGPSAVVIKHTNPCGAASGRSLEVAYRTARDADALSAFGGIVALNQTVDEATATALAETFLEAVAAPGFSPAALKILHARKNLRLISTGHWLPRDDKERTVRYVSGGLLVQDRDDRSKFEVEQGRVVTARAPSVQELEALVFAWSMCKHVKSNAIVLATSQDGVHRTVGVGAGQMSRVVSVEIATRKAGALSQGSVLGSDAFFPFPDGVELAASHGITAIAQPGGSVKDAEVIEVANKHNLAMIFTGTRHFRH